jgi:hypothetical protein
MSYRANIFSVLLKGTNWSALFVLIFASSFMKKFGIIIDKSCNTQNIQAFQIPIARAGISVMIISSGVYFALPPLSAPFYADSPIETRQKEDESAEVTIVMYIVF